MESKWERNFKWWCALMVVIPVLVYYSIRIWFESVPKDTGEKK